MSAAAPVPPDPSHIRGRPVTDQVSTILIHKGHAYRVTFTPPPAVGSKHYISTGKDLEAKIKDLAREILENQQEVPEAELKDHVFQAQIGLTEEGTTIKKASVSLSKRKTSETAFTPMKPQTIKVDEIGQKVIGILQIVTAENAAAGASSKGTFKSLRTPFEAERYPDEDGAHFYNKGDIASAKAVAQAESSDPTRPASQERVLHHLSLRFKPVFPLVENSDPALLAAIPKAIYNPGCNCFINAALIGVLSSKPMYEYTIAALKAIKTNTALKDTNPTVAGLTSPPSLIRLDDDYRKWDIVDPENAKKTFISMTLGQAATCAQDLLERWHRKDQLDETDSQLLRLCLLKLFNKKPPADVMPHVTSGIRISPESQDDPRDFQTALFNGLKVLTAATLPNPALSYELTSEHGKLSDASAAQFLIQFRRLSSPPKSIIISINPDRPDFDASLPERIKREFGGQYDVTSLVVRGSVSGSADSGHIWTYTQVKDADGGIHFYRYDDYREPAVSEVKQEEIVAVCNGSYPNVAPLLFTYTKRSP